MKKFFSVLAVLLCAISLVIFSCGGGGGGAGGATAGTSSGSSSGAGGSAVSIRFNGLYARSAGTVWDTIDYLDIKIFVDGAEALSKHLTASDNIVLIEHLTPGSSVYATGSLKFNEMNDGAEGNIVSDTITLERGSNTLTLNVVYTYELSYITDPTGTPGSARGTYTVAGGIPLPADFCGNYNTDLFTGWLDLKTETDRYPANFTGIRGNVKLQAIYEYIPEQFNISYHFERNGVTIPNENAKVYTYAPSMTAFPDYPYTCDIKLVIDSINPNDITDYYLDPVDPLNTVVTPTRDDDNNIVLYASNDSTSSVGEYVLKSNDGRVSAEHITIEKVDTILLLGSEISSFIDFEQTATDIKYVVNNSTITSISPYAVPSHVQSALTYLELIGTNIESIPVSSFENFTALTTVHLPGSVTSIGSSAFSGCSSLQTVSFSGTIEQWLNLGSWGGLEVLGIHVQIAGGPELEYNTQNNTWTGI